MSGESGTLREREDGVLQGDREAVGSEVPPGTTKVLLADHEVAHAVQERGKCEGDVDLHLGREPCAARDAERAYSELAPV